MTFTSTSIVLTPEQVEGLRGIRRIYENGMPDFGNDQLSPYGWPVIVDPHANGTFIVDGRDVQLTTTAPPVTSSDTVTTTVFGDDCYREVLSPSDQLSERLLESCRNMLRLLGAPNADAWDPRHEPVADPVVDDPDQPHRYIELRD